MKKIAKSTLFVTTLLYSMNVEASDTSESSYERLLAAGGSNSARVIAVDIATCFLPRDFISPDQRIKIGEKLYAAKLFTKSALWMLSGVIDKDCQDSIARSNISDDLKIKGLVLEDLIKDKSNLSSFKDVLSEYWKELDDELEMELSKISTAGITAPAKTLDTRLVSDSGLAVPA